MKTEIHHLIILDESGSMDGIKKQTIDGCNETLGTIRAAQKEFADTQQHFVSIFAFQSTETFWGKSSMNPSRYIVKNTPIDDVKNITGRDYNPGGCTPLYDAVGSTLTDLKLTLKGNKYAIGAVTIITDGYENSSKNYNQEDVADMIKHLKGQGWNFNFIGANIDVDRVAQAICIDNRMAFCADEEDTMRMFARERKAKRAYLNRMNACMSMAHDISPEAHFEIMKKASADYYELGDQLDDEPTENQEKK